MKEWMLLVNFVFLLSLAYYLMTNLQWYSYSILRVLTKHHKLKWHFYYFVFPALLYSLCEIFEQMIIFYIFFILYMPCLIYWIYKLDKPLKWTGRVWRFFGIFLIFALLDLILQFLYGRISCSFVLIFVFSLIFSYIFEAILFNRYKKLAKEKISSMIQLKIILITASYGKTSIKNYLAQILKARHHIYATPRSVNTLKGIIADINTSLDRYHNVYIVEAGARNKGDIAEITEFLNPQYVIIGKIGPQHLEYFGTLENIIETKCEAFGSSRLKYALIESSNTLPKTILDSLPKGILKISEKVENIQASLKGTKFDLWLNGTKIGFETSVLGSFNAYNIALCIEMAKKMGMEDHEIINRVKKLQSVEHRLSKNEVNGKIILDDSFNGNLEGMKEAIRIASEYTGRKVIVTPGIVESTEEINRELALTIDSVFDVVVITGELNAKILFSSIVCAQKILLKDKNAMETTLKACLKEGDLVLFANDAPSYI